MSIFHTYKLVLALLISGMFTLGTSVAQSESYESAEEAFSSATSLLGSQNLPEVDIMVLRQVREILDQILDDFPASDIAVRILFQDTIDELDVSELDRLVNEALFSPSSAEAPILMAEPAAEEETEARASAEEIAEITAAIQADIIAPISPVLEPAVEASSGSSGLNFFDASSFPAEMRPLALRLNGCYARDSSGEDNSKGVILFEVGPNGQLVGVPELDPEQSSGQSIRSIYLNAMIALESCSPFPLEYSGQKLEAVFDPEAIVGLSNAVPPVIPWAVTNSETEAEMELERAVIGEIQARLGLLGFDPNGIDGVFGKGSRAAISLWQLTNSIPETGYIDDRQIGLLRTTSDDLFTDWQAIEDNQKVLERAARAPSRARVSSRWWRDNRGMYCRRAILGTWCQAARPRNP